MAEEKADTTLAAQNENQVAVTQSQKKTVRGWIESAAFQEQIAKALPKHLTPDRFMRVAITCLNRIPKLASCTQESLFKCLLDLSAMGLEPDGRRAHLIPFENNRNHTVECTLVVDYKGLVELVENSGCVDSIHADSVCENDIFDYDAGVLKTHKIDFRKPRGTPYAYYCVIRKKGGGEKVEVMNMEQIYAIRDRSQGYKSAIKNGKPTPWTTDESEMAKKTVFKRASKWVKLSPEIRAIVDREDPIEIVTSPVGVGELTDTHGGDLLPMGTKPPEGLSPKPEPKDGKKPAAIVHAKEDMPWPKE